MRNDETKCVVVVVIIIVIIVALFKMILRCSDPISRTVC